MPLSLSVNASNLHEISSEHAIALVNQEFGLADEWESPIISYRLSSNFQADWKEEIGHWLHTAKILGFAKPLLNRIIKQAKRGTRSIDVDPNDRRHQKLLQELAPAMVVHYLCRTGWQFTEWEPITGGNVDVDVSLYAPDGTETYLQIKAPDQPGKTSSRKIVDGEYDSRIIKAVENAATQLPLIAQQANIIVVCAIRRIPLSEYPQCLVSHLIGKTIQDETGITLSRSSMGKFFKDEWRKISCVVMLDLIRDLSDDPRYGCTVLMNPSAQLQAKESWFPHGKIC